MAGQIAGAGIAGSFIGPCIYVVLVFILGLGPIVLVFAAPAGIAVLYAVARVTARGSPMTATHGGSVLWAAAVLVLGVIGWAAGASALSKLGWAVGSSLVSSLLSAVPFALAAALCAGGWTSIVSIVLTIALILTGCS
ncbi:hypothetical protein ABT294_44825 [Nonomuraea sp. NPDC000554]|uniref:hypothetical protein n=1 Tax=Nonomuraea sp. NPDC000554 TaxID=3154259 RepID=UPI00331E5920